MKTVNIPSTVFVTIKRKTGIFKSVPIWNKVMMNLHGDTSDMQNLMKELEEIKAEVNREVNRKGLALNEVNVTIEIKGETK